MDLHKVIVKEQRTIEVFIQNLPKALPVYIIYSSMLFFFKQRLTKILHNTPERENSDT